MKKLLIILSLFLCISCARSTDAPYNTYDKSDTAWQIAKAPVETPVKVNSTPVNTESETFKKGKLQLKVQGFKNIKEESYPWFCCSEEDNILFSTGFSAETPEGEVVEGCMCGGFFKGVTIRFK